MDEPSHHEGFALGIGASATLAEAMAIGAESDSQPAAAVAAYRMVALFLRRWATEEREMIRTARDREG